MRKSESAPGIMLLVLLLVIPFLAKVSFRFVGFVPESYSVLWLQGGLHPVLNAVMTCVALAIFVFFYHKPSGPRSLKGKAYLTLCLVLLVAIATQSVFQLALTELAVPTWMHLTGLLLTVILVVGYGWVIPSAISPQLLFSVMTWTTRILVSLSLLALLVLPELTFKGTRFIGVFKQIPYMVTVGQLGLLAEWNNIFEARGAKRGFAMLWLLAAFVCLVLTGTRSAVFCALVFVALALLMWPTLSPVARRSKHLAVYVGTVFALTLGPFALAELKAFASGESSFGLRAAQDGVASRIAEIERGFAVFQKEPLLGHGLLHRFSSDSLERAGGYNSFKDPHNVFVSAGVVGGWPLVIVVAIGAVGLMTILLKRVLAPVRDAEDHRLLLIGLYLISHLPILLIYHLHLSLGGLADRVYWLFVGLLCYATTRERWNHERAVYHAA